MNNREMIAYEIWKRDRGDRESIRQFRRQRKYRRDEYLQLADRILEKLEIINTWFDVKKQTPYDMWIKEYDNATADCLVDTFNVYWGNDLDNQYVTIADYMAGVGWCCYGTKKAFPRQEQISHWQKWRPEPPKLL